MKKLFALVILVAILLTAGCPLQRKKGPVGKAISMADFKVVPIEVFSEEEVSAVLKVQNTGSLTAKDLQAKLIGIGGIGNPLKPGYGEGINLLPPIKGEKVGEKWVFDWYFDYPKVPKGLETTARVAARTTFKYKTSAIATVPLVGKEYLRALRLRGAGIPEIRGMKVTKGPLDVEITTLGRIPAVSEDDRLFLVEVIVKNIGEGIVIDKTKLPIEKGKEIKPEDFDILHIHLDEIEGIESVTGKCDAYGITGGDENIEARKIRRKIGLIYNCRLNATKIPPQIKDLHVRVELSYGYLIEQEAAFTVKGKLPGY